MFAQANSEHCRHKIFNADWRVDGAAMPRSPFDMIRHTKKSSPGGVLSAYSDNAAVIEGPRGARYFASGAGHEYGWRDEPVDILLKVETHNHPTAISPFPGAATGSGGEIRDEGATGRGAKPKAGLVGFTVSNLRIPGFVQPWETDNGRPARIASALDIMLEGPIGAAAFNNEFGRPGILGYFRSFEQRVTGDPDSVVRGYHKPIMIAGGLGNVRRMHVEKRPVPARAPLVLLGGPAMLIGLGGGAASSQGSGAASEQLDFASVQRGNPEIQRRAQQVIDACWAMGEANPILMIHDVGAGGLSNAVPEVVAPGGGRIELSSVPSDEPGMSPLEIWCNEAQERYVLALSEGGLDDFMALCRRERCPSAVIGEASDDGRLVVTDSRAGERVVDMPIEDLLGRPPRMQRSGRRSKRRGDGFDAEALDAREALLRLLRLPAIADKGFLITIGDRSVGGMISRDPLVGPWQVPVADVAVTTSGLRGRTGEAMAIGERPAIALLDAPASGRIAVGEAVTNIAAADVRALGDVKLSANWMASCGDPAEDADLYDTVRALGEALCPALGIAIPVGKDSLSMRSGWQEGGAQRSVVAPLSLVVSAFAPVADVRRTLTPALATDAGQHGAPARGSRRRPRPDRRFLPRAGVRSASATCRRTSTTRSALVSFFAAIRELRDEGLAARVSRSLGRRSRRHAARNGLCGAGRDRRGSRRASSSRSPRSSARSSARCCSCAMRMSHAPRRCSPGTDSARSRGASGASRRAVASASRPRAACSSTRTRASFAPPGRRRPGACRGCVTTRPVPTRSATRASTRTTRAWPGGSRSTPTRTSPRPTSRRARARASRSCASRASTARSRWRPPSTARASRPWTCT